MHNIMNIVAKAPCYKSINNACNQCLCLVLAKPKETHASLLALLSKNAPKSAAILDFVFSGWGGEGGLYLPAQ